MVRKMKQQEYDFALIIDGVDELNENIEKALFEAGSDDATFGILYGRLYGEFSRRAKSMQAAILSAIADIQKADIGARVLRVDDCNLVTASEIARRIGRTRQAVHQYITGVRGPGGFPGPDCHLNDDSPLWAWCEVLYWLVENNFVRADEVESAEAVCMINGLLDTAHQRDRNPELADQITHALGAMISTTT